MPKQIIDPLEVINVEQNNREILVVTLGTADFMLKYRVEFPAVVDLG